MAKLDDFTGSVSVVVSSCDAFFDCWQPFAFFLHKFWPDCPFPVYLVINELKIKSKTIHPIGVGSDRGWASNMQRALAQITTPYVLYLQEDYLLTAPVHRQQLADDFAYAIEHDAASFCFYGRSELEQNFEQINERFGVVPQDSDGRTRLQGTLWKRDVLASALRPGETAWNMEARASERTRGLLSLSYVGNQKGPIPYLMSAITRGLWTADAIALCQQHGLRIHPAFRLRYANTKWGRRWRRAVGRARYAIARALQGSKPIALD